MALRLALTPRAAGDIAGIRDYLVPRNPQAADKVRAAIDHTLSLLVDFPRAGRWRPELEAYAVGVRRFTYTIYYRIEIDEIVVVHIRDDRRAPVNPGAV